MESLYKHKIATQTFTVTIKIVLVHNMCCNIYIIREVFLINVDSKGWMMRHKDPPSV